MMNYEVLADVYILMNNLKILCPAKCIFLNWTVGKLAQYHNNHTTQFIEMLSLALLLTFSVLLQYREIVIIK